MIRTSTSDGSYIVIDAARLQRFMDSPQGPAMDRLMRGATAIQGGARAQVGKVTRSLERSIVKRPGVDGSGPFVLIVATVPHGYLHHEGTRPHIIVPRRRKVLRWPAAGAPGGVRFAHRVRHPGTAPNRFLTDNAHLGAL